MSQFAIDFEAARSEGDTAAQACTDKAETLGFSTDAARAFVLQWLTEYGASWGEEIVTAARSTGRTDLTAHKDQAWGSVFSSLRGRHRIRCVEIGMRAKGHGTAGARRWALVQ